MSIEFDLGRIQGGSGLPGPPGAPGPTGPRGPVGPPPDIRIGSVTTLTPGSQGWVQRRSGSPDASPVLDFGLPLAGGDMTASIYDPQERQQDIFAFAERHAGLRPACCVVAAADSAEQDKADFICSGSSDQLTLRQALSSLSNGGRLLLLEGTYLLDAEATAVDAEGDLTLLNITASGVSICGQGPATVLKLDDAVASDGEDEAPLVMIKAQAPGLSLADLIIDGSSAENPGSVRGLQLNAACTRAALRGVDITDCRGFGLYSFSPDLDLTGCRFSGCGCGLYVGGAACVRGCVFEANSSGLQMLSGTASVLGCRFSDNEDRGFFARGSRHLQLLGCRFSGQPRAITLDACTLAQCCFNLVCRADNDYDWEDGEYALLLDGCTEPLVLGNFLPGSQAQCVNCSSPYLMLTGTDWNIS